MTVREWIASQTPPPPSRLAARLSAALPSADQSGARAPRVLLEAATAILRQTITEPSEPRNGRAALDLLAADALITYALEAAADDCDNFIAQTDEMMRRLSSVAVDSTEAK